MKTLADNSVSRNEHWQKLQDDWYANPEEHTHLLYNPCSVYSKDLARHMREALYLQSNQQVLEIGAGAGRFTLHISNCCDKWIALDTVPMLLQHIEKHRGNNSRVETLCANAYELSNHLKEFSMNSVCGFFILHHLLNHERLFQSIWKILKPGGKICFLEPNRINPLFLVQVLISREMYWKTEKGMFTFSITRTAQLLCKLGFIEIKLQRFGFFPPQILDRFPVTLRIQRRLEKFRPLYRFLPFVLIMAKKPTSTQDSR
jgi:ubiquinone/menaquinone biosynthesis C-methylase UbiE